MTGIRVALAIALLGGVLAAACGSGGEQQQNNNMGNMPMPPGQAPASNSAPAGSVEIALTSQPDPPQTGETTFEATVTEGGQPVTNADVSVELFMAAMPNMNMPEMRNSIALKHEGSGRYRGAGNVMMAGSWDATVSVKRGGQEIGNRKVSIVAK